MTAPAAETGAAERLPAGGVVVGHLLESTRLGGAEVYVSLLANSHAARGAGSEVIVLGHPGPLSRRIEPGVHISYLGYRRASIRNPLRFLGSLARGYRLLSETIAARGIRVLQTHMPDTNLWGLVLCMTGRCRVVVTIHNNRFLRNNEGGTSLGTWLKIRAYRAMLKRCAAVVCVSEEVRRSLAATLGVADRSMGRAVVVTNGVPVPALPAPAERLEIRRRHRVEADEPWIVAAGRFTHAKNFACLVDAVSLLGTDVPRPRVLIAGDGFLRPELEAQIERLGLGDRIALPGELDDLTDVLSAADLLAMPSRWEGLPLVLLEAMARGLPVVGTRIPGLADVVTDGRQGLLCAVDDAPGFAAALGRLLRDADLRRRMGLEARELIRERYDFSRVYRDLCRVYADAAASA